MHCLLKMTPAQKNPLNSGKGKIMITRRRFLISAILSFAMGLLAGTCLGAFFGLKPPFVAGPILVAAIAIAWVCIATRGKKYRLLCQNITSEKVSVSAKNLSYKDAQNRLRILQNIAGANLSYYYIEEMPRID